MVGRSIGAVLDNLTSTVVFVEADVSNGLPNFHIVGLPDSAVNESKLRIRSAIRNSGLCFPNRRITVNLSPASLRKRGAGLDLAIAVAILRADGQIPAQPWHALALCGELSLSGEIVPTRGIVNLALALRAQRVLQTVVSVQQQEQCIALPNFSWFPMRTLQDVVQCLAQGRTPHPFTAPAPAPHVDPAAPDFADVHGMSSAIRLLTAAAIGKHPALLIGPPGCGKTMLAERMGSILPDLNDEEMVEVFGIQQAAGLTQRPSRRPPVRMPHHSLTVAGMIGGGSVLTAGEATLAHRGVLVLDELLEFQRATLDALREPLVSRNVRLHRGGQFIELPAAFLLTGTLNPCPCGQHGFGECRCDVSTVRRYWSRLSGPLMDRMDLLIHISPAAEKEDSAPSRSSPAIRTQVAEGRAEWVRRTSDDAAIGLHDFTQAARTRLAAIADMDKLSKRSYQACVRLARSLSIVNGKSAVDEEDVMEAWALRPRPMV